MYHTSVNLYATDYNILEEFPPVISLMTRASFKVPVVKIQRINKTKGWVFHKINKLGKDLAKIIKRHRDSIQIHKTEIKRDRTTKTEEIR